MDRAAPNPFRTFVEIRPRCSLRGARLPLLAAALQSVVNAAEKQRGGIYATAREIASLMTNREAAG